MKKILFYLSSLGRGGAERVVINISAYLRTKSYNVVIVTDRKLEEEYEIPEGVSRINLADEQTESGSRLGRISQRLTGLRKVIKREKPNLVLSFMGKGNLKAIMASSFLNIPVVVSVRADPREEYKGFKNRTLAFTLFRFAKGVIFQTEMAKNFFPEAIRKKAIILGNPINKAFIRPSFQGKRKPEIITVGRLDGNKNHKMLIHAFAMIQDQYPEIKVKIYGTGEDYEVLDAYIKELGVQDQVTLEGQSSQLVDQIYDAAVFVLCSDSEGMPNALMEAMASGVPVIATDCPCGAPADFIQNEENGLLVPVRDDEALAKALQQILDYPEQAQGMGEKATRIADQLAPDVVNASWEAYIEQVLR